MRTVAGVLGHQKGDLGLSMTSRLCGPGEDDGEGCLRWVREIAVPLGPHQAHVRYVKTRNRNINQ